MNNDHGNHPATRPERTTTMHEKKTTVNRAADESAVRDLYRELMDGWNRGSGEAFAAVFTEDGDLIGFDGTPRGERRSPHSTKYSSTSG